ncbi:MAG: hypothetical protein E6G76_23895 [Alphaproteobacteria bacterium]|nr:MAG: hypothetical protein E6G76_23895 [Alphaproteobacteria bacterium]
MSGARHRRKGDRCERELVERHKTLGIHAERYPLSGASRFRGSGHDIDIYTFGREEAPLVAECKARRRRRFCAARKVVEWIRSAVLTPQPRRSDDRAALAGVGMPNQTGAAMTDRERIGRFMSEVSRVLYAPAAALRRGPWTSKFPFEVSGRRR